MSGTLAKVKAISEMDDETFLKHINARHPGILPGVEVVGRTNMPGDLGEHLLRGYHEYVHEHSETNHIHRKVNQ